MDFKRIVVFTAVFLALAAEAGAMQNAFIEGVVAEKESGRPLSDLLVQVFNVSDQDNVAAWDTTDSRGYYNISVMPGNYDVYVRVGRTNPTQTVYVQAGQIQAIDFKISLKSISEDQFVGGDSFWIVSVVAGVILLVILVDQVYFKRKRIISDLAAERSKLEADLRSEDKTGADELSRLKKEKSKLDYMINLTRTKYHERNINEESFREIIRDYQEKLIEVEAKIAALEAEGKK